MRFACLIPFAALFSTAGFAQQLVSSTPAADSSVSKVMRIELHFSDVLTAPAADLVMTAMPGMQHHDPMTIKGYMLAPSADGKALTLTLPRALPAGRYRLDWRGGTAKGTVEFSVR